MLALQNVSKSFGIQRVLDQVSLDINPGSRVCLLGASGVGKSVTTRLFLGLEGPDSGRVIVNGMDTTVFREREWSGWLNQCGVVFQGSALLDSLPVWENIGIKLLEVDRLSPEEVRARASEALASVHLSDNILDKLPAQLSGGMQKRVGIARALLHGPKYMLFDEPTAGLDPANSKIVDELMAELCCDTGRTTFIVTHHLHTVERVADRVLLLEDAHFVFDGTPEEFYSTDEPHVVKYLGK